MTPSVIGSRQPATTPRASSANAGRVAAGGSEGGGEGGGEGVRLYCEEEPGFWLARGPRDPAADELLLGLPMALLLQNAQDIYSSSCSSPNPIALAVGDEP